MFSTVQASDKDGHRLICRTCLHFVIGALALSATIAEELIRRHRLVPLELPLLLNLLLLEVLLPSLCEEFVRVHRAQLTDCHLPCPKSLEQFPVFHIGVGVKVGCNMTGVHGLNIHKWLVGPHFCDMAPIGLEQGPVVDGPLKGNHLRL